jgi:UDP-2,3-diacylglucosamine hydrolase
LGRKLIFLSDVHLYPAHPSRAELFFGFLARQRAEADAIYILGDLFDYWSGAKQARRPGWRALLDRLGESARGGPPIRVLGGNRDYLLDDASLARFGLESLGLEHRFGRDGLRFCLVHGHQQFPESWFSRAFLNLIQRPSVQRATRAVPGWFSLFTAQMMRRWRRFVTRGDPSHRQRYNPAAFLPIFDSGIDVVVCGHNHWAHDYSPELARPGCRLIALGSWGSEPSYLEYAGGEFRLADPALRGR